MSSSAVQNLLLPPLVKIATQVGVISARIVGNGMPLLLLHGIGGNSAVWAKQFEVFAKKWRVVAWDAPGYGQSDLPLSDSPSADEYAGAAIALLNSVGIARIAVIGHSFGGIIASRLAARWPDRICALILSNSSCGHRSYPAQERARILQLRLDPMVAADPAAYARSRVSNLFSADAPKELLAQGIQILSQLRAPGYQRAGRMISDANIFADLPNISVPTIVIAGEQDRVTSPAMNHQIAKSIKSSSFHTIPKAGHWTMLEQPDLFNARVVDFLTAIPASCAR